MGKNRISSVFPIFFFRTVCQAQVPSAQLCVLMLSVVGASTYNVEQLVGNCLLAALVVLQ